MYITLSACDIHTTVNGITFQNMTETMCLRCERTIRA